MNTLQQFVDTVVRTIGNYVPQVIGAILVLAIGWLAALLLKRLTALLLGKIGIDRRIAQRTGTATRIEVFVSGLVYSLALVYVLIITLGVLGIEGVLDPLKSMFSSFVGAVPNIIAALLLGILGFILARICGNVVTALATGIDKFAAWTKLPASFSPSKLLGQIVFLFVFVPALVAALDALQIKAISQPATEMLGTLMDAIPQILAAALILAVAYVAGRFVTEVLATLLANLGADSLSAKLGIEKVFGGVALSRIGAGVAFFFIMLAATVSAAEKLGLPMLTDIVNGLLVFAGNVLLGLVILSIGAWIAHVAHAGLSRTAARGAVAEVARAAILVLVLAMGLRAMGIADDIVNLAFLLSLGAVAVAFALAFGLGGRSAAGQQLDYWFKKLRGE
jgi:hypothetical protein